MSHCEDEEDDGGNHENNPSQREQGESTMNGTTNSSFHLPQHVQVAEHYYRVVCRGMVALSSKEGVFEKNGVYISYGEIVATRDRADHNGRAIRVDRVLTGGYAIDANAPPQLLLESASSSLAWSLCNSPLYSATPKRSNYSSHSDSTGIPNIGPTPLPLAPAEKITRKHFMSTSIRHHNSSSPVGYILLESFPTKSPLVEPLDEPLPTMEVGQLTVQIISSTPLVILTGPSLDAPRTRAVLLPGTIHYTCLQLVGNGVTFFRLSHRRGWVTDRHCFGTDKKPKVSNVAAIKILSQTNTASSIVDDAATTTSAASSSILTTTTTATTLSLPESVLIARQRHRPPRRRRREWKKEFTHKHQHHQHYETPRKQGEGLNQDVSISSTTVRTLSSPMLYGTNISSTSCNVSVLSDDFSDNTSKYNKSMHQTTPDRSISLNPSHSQDDSFSNNKQRYFYLMRVNAPHGLKILDAPHYQVSTLIHGKLQPRLGRSTSPQPHKTLPMTSTSGINHKSHFPYHHHSIFQTMGHSSTTTATTGTTIGASSSLSSSTMAPLGHPAVFDSVKKARILPRGAIFEACERMQKAGNDSLLTCGAGLIQLSDKSGWAIIPRPDELELQYQTYHGGRLQQKERGSSLLLRAYEEIGNAIVTLPPQSNSHNNSMILNRSLDQHQQIQFLQHDHSEDTTSQASSSVAHSDGRNWVRVVTRHGMTVECPPPPPPSLFGSDGSPHSSTAGASSYGGFVASHDSDVTSSVGSAFLDAMFQKTTARKQTDEQSTGANSIGRPPTGSKKNSIPEREHYSTLLVCGSYFQIDDWVEDNHHARQEYVRIRGGQGWIPRRVNEKPSIERIPKPDIRLGSVWFRVMGHRGIKVRLGPSRRASSIKSENGVYFRFECGEFLRASEVVTFFNQDDNTPQECFAKLYRNRHVHHYSLSEQHDQQHSHHRSLAFLTASAEWVQVFGSGVLFLQECGTEPYIQRHRGGWRYNVVAEDGVAIRRGPSLTADVTGVQLLVGESVLIHERVCPPDESLTWLRLKDGRGWVHDVNEQEQTLVVAHSLLDRVRRPSAAEKEVAYNQMVARLFHGDEVSESG